MTNFNDQEREMEVAYRRDVKGPCGPLKASNKTWHREGFEAGYRAALAAREDTSGIDAAHERDLAFRRGRSEGWDAAMTNMNLGSYLSRIEDLRDALSEMNHDATVLRDDWWRLQVEIAAAREDTELSGRRQADPITDDEIAQGRGEFRIADSPAQERAAERLKHERGSIRATFDGLGLGWDYEDVWDYCNGAVAFRTLPRDRRGIVAGMVMGFAIVVVERVRDTERPERVESPHDRLAS